MLANSKGQDLKDHSVAVSLLARSMGEELGLENDLLRQVELAGLFHDIGKSIGSLQGYFEVLCKKKQEEEDEFDKDNPLHHEISWAFLIEKISEDDFPETLSAVYWHHAQPRTEKSFDYFKNHKEILSRVSNVDRRKIEDIYSILKSESFSFSKRMKNISDERTIPSFFKNDSGDENSNAERLIVRSCLISADRYISSLSKSDLEQVLKNKTFKNIVKVLLSSDKQQLNCNYNNERFDIQRGCAEKAFIEATTSVRAPAGFGKTVIGLLWNNLSTKRLVWVCPRNIVATAVYKSIIEELKMLGIQRRVELFLTGVRQQSNFTSVEDSFDAEIIVTNLDNFLSPLVSNKTASRLFCVLGCDVVIDEYHEAIDETPLFSALITLMRARHRICSRSKTLLLSATPTNVYRMWDLSKKKTLHLPSEMDHYPAAHSGSYNVSLTNVKPSFSEDGSLTIFNSIKNVQAYKRECNATIIAHSSYTEEDKTVIMDSLYEKFGKKGPLFVKDSVVAAPIIQAAMDISFNGITESILSPESSLQRLGRNNRWGELNDAKINPKFVMFYLDSDNRSEEGAARVLYDVELQKKWISFLKIHFASGKIVALQEMYKLYNEFYKNHGDAVYKYIIECYKKSVKLLSDKYTPFKIKESNKRKKKKTGGRTLRSVNGSLYYVVKDNNDQWLTPEEVMSDESSVLWNRIMNLSATKSLFTMSDWLLIAKQLYKVGYEEYGRIAKKGKDFSYKTLQQRSRNPETPYPETSFIYNRGNGKTGLDKIGLGLIKQ